MGLAGELFQKTFVQIFAKQLVREAYRGILQRDADPQGLASYTDALKQNLGLAALLRDLAKSDEHWQKTLEARAPELVRALYRGLLDREPEAGALDDYAEKLAAGHDLTPLLAEIAGSDEHWERQYARRVHRVVTEAYRAILGREPDEKGLQNWLPTASAWPDGIRNIVTGLINSEEYKRKAKKVFGSSNGLGRWGAYVSYIDGLYRRYTGKPVDSGTLAQYVSQEVPEWQVCRDLVCSYPPQKKRARVLIFGAYGNGNLGDIYQAAFVRDHLIRLFDLTEDQIFACSLLSGSDYPFKAECKLPPQKIWDFSLINTIDAIVVGGGGLLAHPHEPLFDENWAREVSAPLVLFSVGASRGLISSHQTLLNRCLAVSGRDRRSVDSISLLRKDVLFIPDPILTASLEEESVCAAVSNQDIDILWILKHPSCPFDRELLEEIKRFIREDVGREHMIVAIEPRLDRVLDEIFTDQEVQYSQSLDYLDSLLVRTKSLCFSMRYHGAILAARRNKFVVGASQIKIKDLLEETGLSGDYVSTKEDFGRVMERAKPAQTLSNREIINRLQRQFDESARQLFAPFSWDRQEKGECSEISGRC